jgi:thiol-disulfide isomerase/thioredoxin
MIEEPGRRMKTTLFAFFASLLASFAPFAAADISPDAQKLLNQVRDAYLKVQTLSISGSIKGEFNIDGESANPVAQFTGAYDHGKFISQIPGDAQVGNTGKELYFYLPTDNRFLRRDIPVGSDRLDAIDDEIAGVVRRQNPSLALALAADPAAELTAGATSVDLTDTKLDDADLPALKIVRPDRDTIVAVDPKSHLLRLQIVDLTRLAMKRGALVVKSAIIMTELQESPGASIDPATFAFSPPPGAQALDETPAEGNHAPSFSLTTLDGSQVSSSDLKGSVFVLDFWATWCPPCVASLPKLDDLNQVLKDPDLKIYAVNEAEDKDTVRKFIDSKKIALPILLDTDSKVGEAYGAQAIPYLVIVGRDGRIAKIHIGLTDEDVIRREIQAALGQK